MRGYGQSSFALVGILATPHFAVVRMVQHGCNGCKRFPIDGAHPLGEGGSRICGRPDRAGFRGREFPPLFSGQPRCGFLHRDGRPAGQGSARAVRRCRAGAPGHGLERPGGARLRCAPGPAVADGSRHASVSRSARRGPRCRSAVRGRAGGAGAHADPRQGRSERLAALRSHPASSRDGADAGMVPRAPSRGASRPRGARDARPAVRFPVAQRPCRNRRRSYTAIITRGIFW